MSNKDEEINNQDRTTELHGLPPPPFFYDWTIETPAQLQSPGTDLALGHGSPSEPGTSGLARVRTAVRAKWVVPGNRSDALDCNLARVPWIAMRWTGQTLWASGAGLARVARPFDRAIRAVRTDQVTLYSPDADLNWVISELDIQVAQARAAHDIGTVQRLRADRAKALAEADELRAKASRDSSQGTDPGAEPGTQLCAKALALVLVGMVSILLARSIGAVYGLILVVLALGLLGRTARSGSCRAPSQGPTDSDSVPDEPSTKPHRLTPDSITRAFFKAGTIKNKEERAVVTDVRWETNGESCLVEFPEGVTAEDALKGRVKVAGFYGTNRNLVILTPDEDHEGRLRLHLCETDPLQGEPLLTPLMGRRESDIFEKLPFGFNILGELVTFTFLWTCWLIGAIPRQGKSATGRHMVLTACLDFNVLPFVADPQGLGIWKPLGKIGTYVGGRTDGAVSQVRKHLEKLVTEELPRRQRVVEKYAEEHKGAVRESKVTRDIIRDRSLKCPWLLIVLDECDFYLNFDDIAGYVDELTRRGPAFGISVMLLTQKPDGEVVPTMIRDNMAGRFCLKVITDKANDMVLGPGSHRAGYSSVLLQAGKHVGAGWLRFEDDLTLCRSFYADDAQADEVVQVCYDLRKEHRPEILPDWEDPNTPGAKRDVQLLLDVVAVFRHLQTEAVATTFLRQRLFTLFPERYAGMKGHLPPYLREYGIGVATLDCLHADGMKYTSGIQLSQVLAALRNEGVDTEGL